MSSADFWPGDAFGESTLGQPRLLRIIEKLLGAERELGFFMQIAKAGLERLVVIIVGRLGRVG